MIASSSPACLGLTFPYLTGLLLNASIARVDAAPSWTHNINDIALALIASLAIQAVFFFLNQLVLWLR